MDDTAVFRVEDTHGRVLRAGNELISHSADVGWRSLYAATFREAPLRTMELPIGHPSLIYHIARPTEVTRRMAGERKECTLIGPRRFCLTPGDAAAYWQHSGNPEILQLYLRKSVYENAVQEMFRGGATLVPRFAVVDPLLEQLAIAVMNALREGNADDQLYVDTIAQLIAIHLARGHSSRSQPRQNRPLDGLSPWRIRRLIDYIEQHLAEDLSLEAMAAEVGLNPLYLVRAFRSTVGQSPHRYVVSRRIEHARRLLSGTSMPIAEIALATGFSSQSHLTNWFRRIVGVAPAAYRKYH